MSKNFKHVEMGTNVQYKTRYITQYLGAAIIYLGPIAFGSTVGYSSPVMDDLKHHTRSINLDDERKSLFGSLVTLGALAGALLAGPMVDFLGRKFCIMLTCVPYTIGWVLIFLSNWTGDENYISMIYAGRFITGMCTGIVSMASPVYLSELASPEIRGALGSGFQLFVNCGILIAYGTGSVVSWSMLGVICSLLPVLLIIGLILIPESPAWLVRQNRKKEALAGLKWLRGEDADINKECNDIEDSIRAEKKMSLSEFSRPELYKPFILMASQMFFQQFSGINAVVFNTSDIFESATDALDAATASIVVAAVMVVSTIVTVFVVDRAGRRILLMISAASMAVSTIVLGGYYFAKSNDKSSVANVGIIPVLCLVVFVATFNIGFGPVPWLMMGEVFPAQARGIASSMITAINWTFAFIITLTFEGLKAGIKDHGVFWLFGAFCILACVYVFFKVPETKGKSLDEITKLFTNQSMKELDDSDSSDTNL